MRKNRFKKDLLVPPPPEFFMCILLVMYKQQFLHGDCLKSFQLMCKFTSEIIECKRMELSANGEIENH